MAAGIVNSHETITITYGDQAEAHVGMKKNGKQAQNGLSIDDLIAAKEKFEEIGGEATLYNLNELLAEVDDDTLLREMENTEDAYILVVTNGVDVLLQEKGKNALDMYEEQRALEPDKKFWDIRRKRVLNKHARWNLCFDDVGGTADFETEHVGSIISFNSVPLTNEIREKLPTLFGEKTNKLAAEGNYYYDTRKCGIGYHGDSERKITIGVRLGESMQLCYQWYYMGKPVGENFMIKLGNGAIYAMSEKAVGFDWKRRSKLTLRHAAGCKKYTDVKVKK